MASEVVVIRIEDSDRIRTPVPIESVQRFRGFRTPGGEAVR
jgi:hypothetical protein